MPESPLSGGLLFTDRRGSNRPRSFGYAGGLRGATGPFFDAYDAYPATICFT